MNWPARFRLQAGPRDEASPRPVWPKTVASELRRPSGAAPRVFVRGMGGGGKGADESENGAMSWVEGSMCGIGSMDLLERTLFDGLP
jgi:hypothetical protein